MTVEQMKKALHLSVIHETKESLQTQLTGGYVGDLLSDVMGHLDEQMVWITIQTHRNVVAVATLKEAAALILVQDATLEQEALEMAQKEHLCVYSSPFSAFQIAGELYSQLHIEQNESYKTSSKRR